MGIRKIFRGLGILKPLQRICRDVGGFQHDSKSLLTAFAVYVRKHGEHQLPPLSHDFCVIGNQDSGGTRLSDDPDTHCCASLH